MNKCVFIGDCRTILNNGSLEKFGITDATELAQAVDEYVDDYPKPDDVIDINLVEFKNMCDVKPQHTGRNFLYGKSEKGFYWSYDTVKDIHYFYA
jgi:hypothetical protein